jgi:type VI secretion system VasD/TssJ family lipoprotein
MKYRNSYFVVLLLSAIFALTACTETKEIKGPINKTIGVEAGPNTNQYNGNPNPIVVRLYQLGSRTEFEAATFWDIFNNSSPNLAGAVLDKRSLSPLYPGEKRLVAFDLQPDVYFMAAFAEFSDYENQQFKSVVPISLDRLDNGITVSVASSGVSIRFRKVEDADDDRKKPGFFKKVIGGLFGGDE